MGTQEFKEVVVGAGTNEWDGLETGLTTTVVEEPGDVMGTLNGAYYGLTDGYQNSPNCRWVMKRATLGYIHAHAIDSAGRPMFDQGRALTEIMGIPVVTNSNTTAGNVILADLSYFWIFQGADWGLRTTNEGINLADTAQTMFVMRQENDGRVALAESGVQTTITIV
jgi:HK97 family phage major capsid protein